VLVVQNRAKRTYVEEEVEALQTTAMVLAEMISGELSALAQPGAEPAARHSLHKSGAVLSDGIALGHVVLHEPRVVITNYIAEDLPGDQAAGAGADQVARRPRPRLSAATSPTAASTAGAETTDVQHHGWSHKRMKRSALASPPKPLWNACSPTPARMLRSTDPYLRDACTTSRISAIA
jgi:phosphotransferase system enzyme I (PtsP)